MNILLAVNCIATVLILAFLVSAVVFYLRLSRGFKQFFTPSASDTPSAAALLLDSITARVSEVIMTEFKTTFMGVLSGQARAEKAALKEATQAAIAEKSPMLSAAFSAFPKLGKSLLKNPSLLQFILGKVTASQPAPARAPESGGSGDYAARLQKYGG